MNNIETKHINSLYYFTYKEYEYFLNNSLLYKKYCEEEEQIYSELSINKINNILDEIKDIKSNSILNEILDNPNPIIKRILLLLNKNMYKKIKTYQSPYKSIYLGFYEQYLLSTFIEDNIRKIFLFLLNEHIRASNKESNNYKNTIDVIRKNIIFINNKHNTLNINDINSKEYDIENFISTYLDQMIIDIINEIEKYSDEDLNNDIIFAKVNTLQILLRSIFLLINNDLTLAYYNEYYNSIKNKNEIANNIIQSAFIANFEDTKLLRRN